MTDMIEHVDARTGRAARTGRIGSRSGPAHAGPAPDDGDDRGPRRGRTAWLVAGLVVVAGGIPLAVALGVLARPRWYPLLDLAQTELRVRDVGTRDTPLVGLAGRFDAWGQQGSHLGPLSFWALAPFYRLFGSTAWALQAACATVNLLAMGTATWIAHRRGGLRTALAMALALAVLARAYGADYLTEAWNPYMPMLWWVVFLVAVWSVLCDDLPMLPVAVFAGSFCMQTHIPYLGLVGGLGAFTVAAVLWQVVAARRRADDDDPDGRGGLQTATGARSGSGDGDHLVTGPAGAADARRALVWGAASLVLLAVLWTPPVIDQLVHEPGNMSIVRESLSHSDDEPVGVGRAAEIWTRNLDVTVLVAGADDAQDEAPSGVSPIGLAVAAIWVAAVVVAWRSRHRSAYPELLRLHLVVGVALLLGLVSTSRILGFPWYYLVLWSLGTTTLLVVAVVWTGVLAWRDRSQDRYPYGPGPDGAVSRLRGPARGTIALAAALAITAVAFTFDAASTDVPAAEETRTLRHIAPQTVAALREGEAPGGGEDGRYLVRWEDVLGIGAQGYGLLLELERQGFDVGVPPPFKTGAVAHRARELTEASATVNYVNGDGAIARWDERPGAVAVAYFEPRSDAEIARFDRLHDQVVAGLQEAGLDELIPAVDTNLFVTATNEQVPAELQRKLRQMMDLGLPTAVYVAPPEAG